MGRLIDADILITELKESALHHCNNPREDSLLQRDRVIVRAQPTIEAIPKDQYETRLKADLVAILDEIQLQAEENIENFYEKDEDDLLQLAQHNAFADCFEQYNDLIQQKINTLRGDPQ